MAEYRSKYTGAEVDALLDKIKDDDVGNIDSSLSTTSENPVMNKVVTAELNKKLESSDMATINGQPLTEGGNIEVEAEPYDDTEIKEKLTELEEEIEQLNRGEVYVMGDTLAFRNYADATVEGETLKL